MRRLRIVKYRGTLHCTDEFPFLIGETGISVLPITSMGLLTAPESSVCRAACGPRSCSRAGLLRSEHDPAFGLAGPAEQHLPPLIGAACARGEKALYVALEQSPDETLRNMKGVGLPLRPYVSKGLLRSHALRPTAHGLELTLTTTSSARRRARATRGGRRRDHELHGVGVSAEVTSMVVRLIDYLKTKGVTLYRPASRSGETWTAPERTSLRSSTPGYCCVTSRRKARESARFPSLKAVAWRIRTSLIDSQSRARASYSTARRNHVPRSEENTREESKTLRLRAGLIDAPRFPKARGTASMP